MFAQKLYNFLLIEFYGTLSTMLPHHFPYGKTSIFFTNRFVVPEHFNPVIVWKGPVLLYSLDCNILDKRILAAKLGPPQKISEPFYFIVSETEGH